jgi:glutamyl-Q tRNA(Asp) synthetase
MTVITRFAPSPTGYLHLGHAYSAWRGWELARQTGGRFLLRIEDIDPTRSRQAFVEAIQEDLSWLGLSWEAPVRHQSQHLSDYAAALSRLEAQGLLYPCFCSRNDIAAEIARSGVAPHGPEGALYPGICRRLPAEERTNRMMAGDAYALRLDMAKAVGVAPNLDWWDETAGVRRATPERFGDVVLARKETPTSYHLAVVVDDALQGVTDVTRGVDLLEATDVHRLLQSLLGLPTPRYRHHALITDADGRRLAKRDQAETLRALRERGVRAADLLQRFKTGLFA